MFFPYNPKPVPSEITDEIRQQVVALKSQLNTCDAVIIGAGAGLSTSAGFRYSGERFDRYFSDFKERFGIKDIYSGGFYPFPDKEMFWAWWSRHIYINRYVPAPKPVYIDLLDLVKGKAYFVLTTNVDHQFQRTGFDKQRLFYTQGDYGLWQSVNPKIRKTYDNEDQVYKMLEAQGFVKDENGIYQWPEGQKVSMRIPTDLIPKCPDDGSDMTTNLRADDKFVEDDGWYAANDRYYDFLEAHQTGHVLYLELGVGMNTPSIIKFPFWRAVASNPEAFYGNINYGEAAAPKEIQDRSICINYDIGDVLTLLKKGE